MHQYPCSAIVAALKMNGKWAHMCLLSWEMVRIRDLWEDTFCKGDWQVIWFRLPYKAQLFGRSDLFRTLSSENLQGWKFHTLPGKPAPVTLYAFVVPYLTWISLTSVYASSCPSTLQLWEESSYIFSENNLSDMEEMEDCYCLLPCSLLSKQNKCRSFSIPLYITCSRSLTF